MVRGVALLALFACHGIAMQVSNIRDSPVNTVYNIMVSLLQHSQDMKVKEEKACASGRTADASNRDTLKAELTSLIGSNKAAGSVEKCWTDSSCTGEWAEHDGAYDAANTAKIAANGEKNTAAGQLKKLKYGSTTATQCATYSNGVVPDSDVSICATNQRIKNKQSSQGTVARDCKKTLDIMEHAIAIYSAKGLPNFIQLSQTENIRADAQAFLQSEALMKAGTSRSDELLKLLHDFHAQAQRDCHQDDADLRSDIHSLNLHLQSQKNNVASEQRTYENAVSEEAAEDAKKTAASTARTAVQNLATKKYKAYKILCPPQGSGQSNANTDGCYLATGAADWVCTHLSSDETATGRKSCDASLQKRVSECNSASDDLKDYQDTLKKGIAIITPSLAGGPPNPTPTISFVQLATMKSAAPKEEAPKTALTQAKAVDVTGLISKIATAIENEIAKANSGGASSASFADNCKKQTQAVDAGAGGATDDCKVEGVSCNDPMHEDNLPCQVCLQGLQCASLTDQMDAHSNTVAVKQNAQDQADENLRDSEHKYATAKAAFLEAESTHTSKKLQYDDDVAALKGVQTDFNTFTGGSNVHTDKLEPFMTILGSLITNLDAAWNDYDGIFQAHKSQYEGAATTTESEAAYKLLVDTNCVQTNADRSQSYYCQREDAKADKLSANTKLQTAKASHFGGCAKSDSALNTMKAAAKATGTVCKTSVVSGMTEKLERMRDALQILQQYKADLP